MTELTDLIYRAEIGSFVADTVIDSDDELDVALSSYTRGPVAIDTETVGLDPFRINCLTASWWVGPDRCCSVLLDPLRRPNDFARTVKLTAAAESLVLQNAAYDVPGMFHHQLIDDAGIDKIFDTLVYARMAVPDPTVRKKLEDLAARYLKWNDFAGGMTRAFHAAGFKTAAAGFGGMDITAPVYRMGAVADTAATLRLAPLVEAAAIARTLDHPFQAQHGLTDRGAAAALAYREQRVHRVMLAANARGFVVDTDFLAGYQQTLLERRDDAESLLTEAGIRPGNGTDLVNKLDRDGALPPRWPRTGKTRQLAATKDLLEKLDHPLGTAHRALAHADHLLNYMDGVLASLGPTQRLHPQTAILGASATGRMSMSSPPLHQFPPEARPMIGADATGFTSIDWSQIEPVTLANMAHDTEFLAPFEAGADLYEPIQRSAAISRDSAKVVMLASLYGQGLASLGYALGVTEQRAGQIRRQLHRAMPRSRDFMALLSAIGSKHGMVVSVAGRILTIPTDPKNGRRRGHLCVNYTVQSSAYDVLAEAIVRCADAGLGGAIRLAMHDELVIDTDAADEITAIMLTPPQCLIEWAQRMPVLRVDRKDLGACWKKEK